MVKDFGSKFWEDILKLMIGVMAIIIINQLAERYFLRLDLTEENRYSLTDASKSILRDLDEVVYVEIYLEGDLPSGFRRLRKAIAETLEEFRIYAGDNLQYSFIDPYEGGDQRSQSQLIASLAEKGVQPTDVYMNEGGERMQKRILPGALVSYGSLEEGVNLFKTNVAADPQEQLNQAVEGLEYELISAIHKLSSVESHSIGLVKGHEELQGKELAAFRSVLSEKFIVRDVSLMEDDLSTLDCIILARPQTAFTENEKFEIDQFIMNGGRTIFLLDKVQVNIDSIREGTVSFALDLNLQDLLFRYGIRINADLVQDIISGTIPVVVGQSGDQPQIRDLPWPYYLVINNFSSHPITRNMDAVYLKFASSIDTVKAVGVRKTPLIFSSGYSRTLNSPITINIDALRREIPPENFNRKNIPLGYLLEGEFTSLYKNRILPGGYDPAAFKEQSSPNKIIVFSDGDLARNELNPRTEQPLPLGKEPYRDHVFANRDLLMNAVTYLLDEDGIIAARSKEVMIRPLDKVKIKEERTRWQLVNLILPVIFIIVFGMVRVYLRKMKYSK